jgi:hypothetical protein
MPPDANPYTIHNARSHLYWNPSDTEKLRTYPMPKPREREMVDPIRDHQFGEEGLLGNMSDDQRPTLSRLRKDRPDDAISPFSLRDLPWPIPWARIRFRGA